MVWTGISLGFGSFLQIIRLDSMSSFSYRYEALDPHCKIVCFSSWPYFYDDNARPRRAVLIENYLEGEGIVRME